jgi:hypothetical protein
VLLWSECGNFVFDCVTFELLVPSQVLICSNNMMDNKLLRLLLLLQD